MPSAPATATWRGGCGGRGAAWARLAARRRLRRRSRRRALQPLDVAPDDPPVRAGALHLARGRRPACCGQAARQRRGEDALAPRRRGGRGCGAGACARGCAPATRSPPRAAGGFSACGRLAALRRAAAPGPGRSAAEGGSALSPSPFSRAIGVLTFTLFRALGNQDRLDHALVDRLDLHGRLVGLDLGDHVAGLHRVAHLHVPLGERALLHGGRQGRHQDVGHAAISSDQRRPALATPAPGASQRSRSS